MAMLFKISLFQGPKKTEKLYATSSPESSTPHFCVEIIIAFWNFLFIVKLKLDFHKILRKFLQLSNV